MNPYVTVARAEQTLKVSNPTARHAVAFLQKHRVLKEVSGRQWGKLHLTQPILGMIEKP